MNSFDRVHTVCERADVFGWTKEKQMKARMRATAYSIRRARLEAAPVSNETPDDILCRLSTTYKAYLETQKEEKKAKKVRFNNEVETKVVNKYDRASPFFKKMKAIKRKSKAEYKLKVKEMKLAQTN